MIKKEEKIKNINKQEDLIDFSCKNKEMNLDIININISNPMINYEYNSQKIINLPKKKEEKLNSVKNNRNLNKIETDIINIKEGKKDLMKNKHTKKIKRPNSNSNNTGTLLNEYYLIEEKKENFFKIHSQIEKNKKLKLIDFIETENKKSQNIKNKIVDFNFLNKKKPEKTENNFTELILLKDFYESPNKKKYPKFSVEKIPTQKKNIYQEIIDEIINQIIDNYENSKIENLNFFSHQNIDIYFQPYPIYTDLNSTKNIFSNNLSLENFSPSSNIISEEINSSENETLKHENSHDKNENDTDTAYSSSNKSDHNPENIDIPCINTENLNLSDPPKTLPKKILKNKFKNENQNFDNLKKNLKEKTNENINNYLISPKNNNEIKNLKKKENFIDYNSDRNNKTNIYLENENISEKSLNNNSLNPLASISNKNSKNNYDIKLNLQETKKISNKDNFPSYSYSYCKQKNFLNLNNKNNLNPNYPNSPKSDKIFFKEKNDLFYKTNNPNSTNSSTSNMITLSNNKISSHINNNNYNSYNKNYFSFNSPNSKKNIDVTTYNKISDKNINFLNNGTNNISNSSSSLSDNQNIKNKLKPKNKHFDEYENNPISKDDLNIIKSKALNFTEIQTEINKINSLNNGSVNQAPVYQSYIPKNVNFRNFNYPIDFNLSFNNYFNNNYNYNLFYPGNVNNSMNFMYNFKTNYNMENNFNKKLHKDILEYNEKLEKTLSITKSIKNEILNILKKKISEFLNFLNIEIKIYGSFVNELSIESSDVDISIKYENKPKDFKNMNNGGGFYDIDYIIAYLTNAFNSLEGFEKVNPIYTASVPIIKLVNKINLIKFLIFRFLK